MVMAHAPILRTQFSTLAGRIDTEAGVIYGVAVITKGPALGHGMMIDDVTLSGVVEQANTYEGGMKVKLDHTNSAGAIVGFLRGFRIEGDTVRADLTLLKSSPHRGYVLELAATIPDTFGLSIAFSGVDEEISGTRFARCTEIYSADLVSDPAANPNGLFSQPTQFQTMTPEEIKAAIAAAIAPLVEKIAAIEAATVADTTADAAEMSTKMKDVAKEAALSVLREFSATLPAPVAVSAPAPEPTVETFETVVRALKSAGIKHNDAIRKAMSEKPDLYASYLSRAQKGEVILF
jgi:hypothetical protein